VPKVNDEKLTATERLRQLLDERGVEWWEVENDTRWEAYDAEWRATENGDGRYLIFDCQDCILPEEAVEATLGRGTCKWEPADFITEGEWWNTSCGESFTWEPDGTPNYCPNCGRRVVP
jgi:hypothetical protein